VTNPGEVEYLIVAGGGGGGAIYGAGGGAGGVLRGKMQLSTQSYTVTVGAGGAGSDVGINGSDSAFAGLTAIGGGGGGGGGSSRPGKDGGSGGGAGYNNTPGNGISGQGNRGGLHDQTVETDRAGGAGGGGAGSVGGPATLDIAGAGGQGILSQITGTPTFYAGGGAGGLGELSTGPIARGGLGGGGGGVKSDFGDSRNGISGSQNTGGGGGGGGGADASSNIGGNGGSGIVIIRYPRNASTDTAPDRTVTATQPNRYQIVQDGLILHLDAGNPVSYPGTGTVVSNLAPNNNFDLIGGTQFLPQYGGIFDFDGVNDRIETNINPNLDNKDFAYAVWYKNEEVNISSSSNDAIVSNYAASGTTPNAQLHILQASGKIRYFLRNSGGTSSVIESQNRIDDGIWHYIVSTVNGSTMSLYVDGTLQGTNTAVSGTITSGQTLTIGSGHLNRFHPNQIGAAYVYVNKGLSQSEVLQNFNATRYRFGV